MDFRLKQRKNRFFRKAIDFININMKKFDYRLNNYRYQ